MTDIYEELKRMEEDHVFAIPTLLKRHSLPLRRLIGDLSDTGKLRSCLGFPDSKTMLHEQSFPWEQTYRAAQRTFRAESLKSKLKRATQSSSLSVQFLAAVNHCAKPGAGKGRLKQ